MTKKRLLNNPEEYDNPIQYDIENDSYIGEVPFLTEWATKKSAGLIIDLACGTGRVTIPLASKGYELMGIDIHRGMLEQAHKKASQLNLPIQWVEQDCTNLHLNVTSSLIYMVGNSFQHFHTNESQDQLLTSVCNHLESEGIFIFGTRFPSAEELLQPYTEEYWRTYRDQEKEQEVDLYTISHYDSLQQIQYYTTIRKYKNEEGLVVDENRTNISLRYVYPKEMERVLSSHGFEIVHVYKDWNKTAITNDSYEMIYVCQKKQL